MSSKDCTNKEDTVSPISVLSSIYAKKNSEEPPVRKKLKNDNVEEEIATY